MEITTSPRNLDSIGLESSVADRRFNAPRGYKGGLPPLFCERYMGSPDNYTQLAE